MDTVQTTTFICPKHGTVHDTKFYITGGWHFDGEPWDDIEEHLVCAQCGEEVTIIVPPIPEDEEPPF